MCYIVVRRIREVCETNQGGENVNLDFLFILLVSGRDYYHTCYCLSGLSIAQHSPNGKKDILGIPENELAEIDPVYNIGPDKVRKIKTYFANKQNGGKK